MLACLRFSPLHSVFVAAIAASTISAIAQNASPASLSATTESRTASYGNLPLNFEVNQGQVDSRVQFLSRGSGYAIFLTGDGAVLELGSSERCGLSQTRAGTAQAAWGKIPAQTQTEPQRSPCAGGSDAAPDVVRMTLAGATNAGHLAKAVGEEELPGKVNYFLGNDPTRWRADVPTYAKVRYSDVYPGIDLIYYGNERQLEYDFVVAPGVDTSQIQLQFAAAKRPRIDANGDLVIDGSQGEAVFHKPLIYQNYAGGRQSIPGNFRMLAKNTVGFTLGRYDHTRPLIIDPVLVYSTYLGGSGSDTDGDAGNSIVVDAEGSAYVVGTAQSPDFPVTEGAFQTTNKPAESGWGSTVFVTKFNASGTALVYSTFLGGSGQKPPYSRVEFDFGFGDFGMGIALDAQKNAYLTGYTFSSDFPVTAGAFQTSFSKTSTLTGSAFLTKLNASGSALIYSTYLGGSANDFANAVAIDSTGNAYVAGGTLSSDFPVTTGSFQTSNKAVANGTSDAFVTKMNSTGTSEIYSTFLGGSGTYFDPFAFGDQANAIAIDGSGYAYIAGITASPDFPVSTGAFQTKFAPTNLEAYPYSGFVTKLDPTGGAETYSTYLGGPVSGFSGPYGDSPQNSANAIAVDSQGEAYIAGLTFSLAFPVTTGALQTTGSSNGNAFVSKLNAAGSALEFSTYLGGLAAAPIEVSESIGGSSATGIQLDGSGNIYLVGYAANSDFPVTPDAIGADFPIPTSIYENTANVFVAKMNPSATALEYSTMLGGNVEFESDLGNAIALDLAGNVYATGLAGSKSFPVTPGAFQTSYNPESGGNAFVSKLALSAETQNHYPTQTTVSPSLSSVNQGSALTLTATVTSSSDGTPTGTVTFLGETATATVTLNDGTASWTPDTLTFPAGPNLIYADYSGDASHLSSVANQSSLQASFRVVGPPATLKLLTSSSYSFRYGTESNIPVSVQAFDSTGTVVEGATVSFSGAGLGFAPATAITNTNGIATTDFAALKAGSLVLTVSSGSTAPISIPVTVAPGLLTVYLYPLQRLYGSVNPTLAYTIMGLVNGDTVTVTPSTTATSASPVGSYPISATVTGAALANYTLTLKDAMLTVAKAPLSIVAKSVSSTYGQTPPTPTAYTLTGFVNGDTASVVSGAPILSTTVTATTPVGFYQIGVAVGTLSAVNYSFKTTASGMGVVGVYKAPLEITVNDLTMTEGSTVPTLTYTLTGFVNGDTAATAVTGTAVLSTTATSSSLPGNYPITFSKGTLASKNYALDGGANGVLKVVP